MICPICRKEIKDNSKFCGKCGSMIPRCPSCGKVIEKKVRFCIYDGTPLGEELTAMLPQEVNDVKNIPQKKRKVWILILVSVISLLLVAGIVVCLLYCNGKIDFLNREKQGVEAEVDQEEENVEQESLEAAQDETEVGDGVEEKHSEELLKENSDVEATVDLNVNIEEEVLAIREVYNDIVEKINGDDFEERNYANGAMAYFEQGKIKAIIVPNNMEGSTYQKAFYYDTDKLIFAYYEAEDAHRLYWVNDTLIRWRYSADAKDAQNAQDHDMESSFDYEYWNMTAKNESDYYLKYVQYGENVAENDYILEESDSRYLTLEELDGMNADECRLARNEIYARHGRKFSDESLQAYFLQFDWYEPTIEPEAFDESMLNSYELENRDLIVQYEEEMGYR